MAVYVIGEGNNFYESMTKEQILAAITQAVESHTITDVDTGFVTKLKENNKNKQIAMWVGTEAEYNAIQEKDQNTLYIKTDDSTVEAIEEAMETFGQRLSALETLAGEAVFKSGDNGNLKWTGAGYITDSAKKIVFTVPLPKVLPSGLIADLLDYSQGGIMPFTAFTLAVVQNGNYIVGSGSEPATWSSEDITTENNGNMINFQIYKGDGTAFANAITNETVGIVIRFNYFIH